MQSKIRVLSEQTINQIAAGEVIENPASVVKEIVENAIDAESTEITVEIVSGGRSLIRVTDNGFGMSQDDAVLCLERHATSKIKNVDDIQTIMTMGFRGEAIPSIASISKFTILTKAKDEESATLVVVDGGKLLKCAKAVRDPGTTMEVQSLFYNVPVRRKFQKSPTYDSNEILKILSLIALGNPDIKFELISNEKKVFTTSVLKKESFLESLKQRIHTILGADFSESLCAVDGESNGFKIQGFIGIPSVTRQNRTGQYLFINQRGVSNPFISYSIRDAYGTTLPTNRHPIYVLHLTIPGDLVDVNVHPQKREVRLRQEQLLKELMTKSIEKALQTSGFSFHEEKPESSFAFLKCEQTPAPFSFQRKHPYIICDEKETYISQEKELPWEPKIQQEIEIQPEFFQNASLKKQINVLTTIPQYILVDPNSLESNKPQSVLCLVDQKAAHSRIIYEKLCNDTKSAVQPLLIPHSFETTPLDAAFLLEELNFLNKIGIEIHQGGPKTFIVEAVPDFFKVLDVQSFLIDLIDQLKTCQNSDLRVKEKEKHLAICASRNAISQNKTLITYEAKNLIDQLMTCKMPYQCPKGKQIFAFITKDELKNFF